MLVDEFEATNPESVQGYHINSSVDNIGVRHSGIEGKVRIKDDEALANAVVQLDDSDKAAVTDLKGFYRLECIAPNDYKVSVSADAYNTHYHNKYKLITPFPAKNLLVSI